MRARRADGRSRSALLGLLAPVAALALACGPPPPEVGPTPDERPGEGGEEAPGAPTGVVGDLPPIPRRIGPLDLRVQYPERHQRIAVRDSNFLFGSVGSGDATLEVDGRPVRVEPNGAFLVFLPVPPARGDTATYRIVARRPGEVDTLLHPIRVPSLPYVGSPGTVWLDTTGLTPPVERWALPDEPIVVSVRGAPGLRAWLEVGGERFPLVEGPDPAAARLARERASIFDTPLSRRYEARIRADRLARRADGGTATIGEEGPVSRPDPLATPDTLELTVVAERRDEGEERARLEARLPLRVLDPEALPVVELREAPDSVNGQSGVVVGRPRPYGPYRWRFPPGTRALVDQRVADRLRLRLAPHEFAWVLAEDLRPLPEARSRPRGRVGGVRVEPRADRLIVHLELEDPLPIQVDQPTARSLVLTLYGAEGDTDRIAYGTVDPLLDSVRWEQAAEGIYRIVVDLTEPVWGHRATYDWPDGDPAEGGSEAVPDEAARLRFEIRRPPRIDSEHPLRGRRIAVDPGHPGGGAHGPTGLYEGDANLAIARRLVRMLAAEGAEPILIRDDTLPMGLYERTARAIEAGAELFVSIHNNALPDGVAPLGREGTSTLYYHPHARELAQAVQTGLLVEMGLRDLGIMWGDLAVARLSWMPSVLAEGAFMMIPSHEAALRDPELQSRYARGVLSGLRAFLSTRRSPGRGSR